MGVGGGVEEGLEVREGEAPVDKEGELDGVALGVVLGEGVEVPVVEAGAEGVVVGVPETVELAVAVEVEVGEKEAAADRDTLALRVSVNIAEVLCVQTTLPVSPTDWLPHPLADAEREARGEPLPL